MYEENYKNFNLWLNIENGIIRTMKVNIEDDFNAGYSLEMSFDRINEVEKRKRETKEQIEKFKNMSQEQVEHWCYINLKYRDYI